MNSADYYFIVSIIGILFTLNALAPIKWARICVFTFFAGWFTGELALLNFIWQAIATAIFIYFGACKHVIGIVGLGITVISWIGLLKLEAASKNSLNVFVETFSKSNGKLKPKIDDVNLGFRESRIPIPYKSQDIKAYKHIDYFGDNIHKHKLDIYKPLDLKEGSKAPVLFYIHGGAWIVGDKREQGLPMIFHMVRKGWVCVSVNYRLSPRATWPDHIVDCKKALSWLKANIASYGGDPESIVVSGGSAGGHLAALVALTQSNPMFQPGFEQDDTSVIGCIPFYGVYDFTNSNKVFHKSFTKMIEKMIAKKKLEDDFDLFKNASPYHQISKSAPPFFVIAGRNDTLVPINEARTFVEKLRLESDSEVLYAELPYAQHAFEIFPSLRAAITTRAVEAFLFELAGSKISNS